MRIIKEKANFFQMEASYYLGQIYLKGYINNGNPQYNEAYRCLINSAYIGYHNAMISLGDMLMENHGTGHNDTEMAILGCYITEKQ